MGYLQTPMGVQSQMRFLIDTNPKQISVLAEDYPEFVAGQLIQPMHTRSNWGGAFAMDNAAFTGFNETKFKGLQGRNQSHRDRCLFATCPDVVGNMRRTLEVFRHRDRFANGFELSLVLQNGAEDMEIPWDETPAIFIGGLDPWKESAACRDLITTAKIFGLHVHCGRVNEVKRFEYMSGLGVDTCDGSGVAQYGNYQLIKIVSKFNGRQQGTLFPKHAARAGI